MTWVVVLAVVQVSSVDGQLMWAATLGNLRGGGGSGGADVVVVAAVVAVAVCCGRPSTIQLALSSTPQLRMDGQMTRSSSGSSGADVVVVAVWHARVSR